MEKKVKYTVVTKTSNDYKVGATDGNVYIMMIGCNGRVAGEWVQLDNFFTDDFELGEKNTFHVESRDVGLPEAIRLKIDKVNDRDGWLCSTVTVKHPTLGEIFFAVHDVVMDEISVRSGPASLPQKDTSLLYRDMRQNEITRNKAMYTWHLIPVPTETGWDLPRFCMAETFDDLPLLFKINDIQLDTFQGNREKAMYNTLLEHGSSFFKDNSFKDYDDFKNVFHLDLIPSEMPPFYDVWEKDEEFGRQMLSGVNPTVITRCRKLPEEFVKDEERIFGDKHTCEKELKKKHLYWINYRGVFDGLKRNKSKGGEQLYCTDSICLFQVGSDKQLRPIAIQLEKDGYVFTPKDQEHDWMLAKMYFRNSDANVHEFQSHLLRTHIVIEPIGIALFQCLSRHHPVYKLLRPHLQTVAAINTLGRSFLIGPDASSNFTLSINGLDMTRHAFNHVVFEDLIISNTFKRHGTDDSEALPHYNYREDALQLWEAIEKYTEKVISYYYKSNKDVVEDPEISDFIRNVAENGIGWNGEGTKGFPVKLHTIEELIQYCTIVIYTSSVQHAASNFGQFEIYKFCPNAPAGMRLPPHKKGEGSMKRILDSLPDPIMACLQVGTAFTLSAFSPNEIFLGDYPIRFFDEKAILEMQNHFRKELEKISKAVQKRNKSLAFPYTYLLPERIPNSIAV